MITLKVTPADGAPYIVVATSRDVLVWEKTSKGKSFTSLMVDPHLQDLYRIGHLASWRQQLFTGSLQEFEESCEIDLEEEQEEEPDPTRQGPSTGPSSPSPSAPASPRPSGRKRANKQ